MKSNLKQDAPAWTDMVDVLISAADYVTGTVFEAMSNKGLGHDPTQVVFENNTPFKWEVYEETGKAIHGTIDEAPEDIPSLLEVIKGQDPSSWSTNPDSYNQENYTQWSLKSNNQGTEFVAVFKNKNKDYIYWDESGQGHSIFLVIFTYNDIHRSPHAGAMICNGSTFKEIYYDDKNEKGTGLRNHIRDVNDGKGTAHTKYKNDGMIRVTHRINQYDDDIHLRMSLSPATKIKVKLELHKGSDATKDPWEYYNLENS